MPDIPSIKKRLEQEVKQLRAPGGYLYAGLPRFKGLFGRDSCISSLQFLEHDPSIARATLSLLARWQGKKINYRSEEQPGKILHEYYEQITLDILRYRWRLFFIWKFPYYGALDSTSLFLVLLGEYIRKTNDLDFARKLWPAVAEAYRWMIKFGDRDGDSFLEYQRLNPRGILHQVWKDSELYPGITLPVAPIEVQGYTFAAFLSAAHLGELIGGNKDLPDEARQNARLLQEKLAKFFWMPEAQYFAWGLDGDKRQLTDITSNPGHLLFCGILDKTYEEKIIERLFAEDMWTPFGIRTYSTKSPHFDPRNYHLGSVWPHDNWIIWLGLKRRGYHREARRIFEALLAADQALGGRLPELYGVDAQGKIIETAQRPSYPQAWATGALLSMIGYYEKGDV